MKKTHTTPEANAKYKAKYLSTNGCAIYNENVRGVDEQGNFLFELLKGQVPADVRNQMSKSMSTCATSNERRGPAAGPITKKDLRPNERIFNDYTKIGPTGYRFYKVVNSCVVGVTKRGQQSLWTKTHLPEMPAIHKCIQFVDRTYKTHIPDMYKVQKRISSNITTAFPKTVFNSLTVNKNFRTAAHRDFNLKSTYSLLLIAGDEVTGGELIFPEYKVACKLQPGDMLLFDGSMFHGNAPFTENKGKNRISFVFYQL
jgi:hypothetical protein